MIFPARFAEEETKILHQFCHGDGPDQEDIKMFQLALMMLKKNGEDLVKDVH